MTVPDRPDWVGQSAEYGVFDFVGSANLAAGGTSPTYDVTAYAAIIVTSGAQVGGNIAVEIRDTDTGSTVGYLTVPTDTFVYSILPTTIPLLSKNIQMINRGPSTLNFEIIGTNRVPPGRALRLNNTNVDSLFVASAAIAPGQIAMGHGAGQGQVYTAFTVSAGALAGEFAIVTQRGGMAITDTSLFHAVPDGTRGAYVQWIAPIDDWKMVFNCNTGGTSVLIANSVYL